MHARRTRTRTRIRTHARLYARARAVPAATRRLYARARATGGTFGADAQVAKPANGAQPIRLPNEVTPYRLEQLFSSLPAPSELADGTADGTASRHPPAAARGVAAPHDAGDEDGISGEREDVYLEVCSYSL
jgi:hypothetical protein